MSLGPDDPRIGPPVGGVPLVPGIPGGVPPWDEPPAPDTVDEPSAGRGAPAFAETGPPSGPAAGKHSDPEGLSLGELFAEVSRDLSTLFRQEVDLAKSEAMISAKRAGRGAGMLGGAGYAGGMVLLFLSIALWWAIGTQIGYGWSALIVAAVWAIVAAVLAARGRSELKKAPGLPETADSLKKIPHALQGHEEKNR